MTSRLIAKVTEPEARLAQLRQLDNDRAGGPVPVGETNGRRVRRAADKLAAKLERRKLEAAR